MSIEPSTTTELELGYSLEHFKEFLTHLQTQYSALLNEDELRFLQSFQAISLDAQRLFVRLANRKPMVFFIPGLRYPEIGALQSAVHELVIHGFVRRPGKNDFEVCLQSLTVAQLRSLLIAPGRSKKSELHARVLQTVSESEFLGSTLCQQLLIQHFGEEIAFFRFLVFGDTWSDLRLYAIRDLGLRQSNQAAISPRFHSAAEARSEYQLEKLREQISAELRPIPAVHQLPPPIGPGASRVYEKLIWEIARGFEREERIHEALEYLHEGNSARILERRIRLEYGRGNLRYVQDQLASIIDDPIDERLALFAEDFLERKFNQVRLSATTRVLKNATVLPISARYRGSVEAGVCEHFLQQGRHAVHTENRLWRLLFSLVFWDLLFDGPQAAIHSEFDWFPSDLRNGVFHLRHQAAIATRLGGTVEELIDYVGQHSSKLIAREFCTLDDLTLINDFLARCVRQQISPAPILYMMASDFSGNSAGFPDILILDDTQLEFIEVKSPGDSLNRSQLRAINSLLSAGFKASVLRVSWQYDPNQEYLVVDLETTGLNARLDRVTEIAARRIRNGMVIDQFSTLVNPKRMISKQITQLTGISNELVATAPEFATIADSFATFAANTILVAHNAQFDHAFLAAEYRRLGIRFSKPTFCTAREARAQHPGLPSYSLAQLCEHFAIPLENHHRADSDVDATVALFGMLLPQPSPTEAEDCTSA